MTTDEEFLKLALECGASLENDGNDCCLLGYAYRRLRYFRETSSKS